MIGMLKRLSRCIKGYGKETFFSPLFIALEVIIECIIPYVTAELVNYLKNAEVLEMAVIGKYGLTLVLLAFASLTCGVLSGWFCATTFITRFRNIPLPTSTNSPHLVL